MGQVELVVVVVVKQVDIMFLALVLYVGLVGSRGPAVAPEIVIFGVVSRHGSFLGYFFLVWY